MTTLIISNKEMKDIMKVVKSLEESGLLMKGASETIENEAKEQKDGFLGILFGTLAVTWQVKELSKLVKEHQQQVKDKVQLVLVRIFNSASSFNYFLKLRILRKT